ncbi:hypothetical protein [Corynebacterium pygosceleis]|uniref:Uncharacterized protein n=1 Tax=Corynebacterium pygosceleis TaxID=2800406 RepID=A0A9Q4GJ65_9CORY|nr:hypothetical protein [Corynebacterium pygosceleis]MCK7638393.1 hypothetical protein [Corynebacterium pygosceleis]MCK7675373.1 hypothetical protein [Corynebacterium pygosceleis]MCL0121233.1 hypothetical protein [Corynebacterium pygosceleis]MCX7445448.1 hypothetical protein [Corynebacterium pygosceleis]MCX7469056.1 hypothetical protein [Corynebacterium pygosceleis]
MTPLPPPPIVIAAVLAVITAMLASFTGGSSEVPGSSRGMHPEQTSDVSDPPTSSTTPGTPRDPTEPEPEPAPVEKVTPRPETTVLGDRSIVNVAGNRADGYRIELHGRHELRVGAPVVVPVTDRNPTGVVGRVTGVEHTATGTTFTAEAAPLDAAYTEFRISREIPVDLPVILTPDAFTCDGSPSEFHLDAPGLRAVVTLRLDVSRETAAVSTALTGPLTLDAATGAAVFCTVDPSRLPRSVIPVEGPLTLTVGATVSADATGPADVHVTATEEQTQGAVIVGARSLPVTEHRLRDVSATTGDGTVAGEDGVALTLGGAVALSTGPRSVPGLTVAGDTTLSVFPSDRSGNRRCTDIHRQQTVTVDTPDRGLLPWSVTPLSERNDTLLAAGSCPGGPTHHPLPLPGGGDLPNSPVGDREVVTVDGPLDTVTVTGDLRCEPHSADGVPLLPAGPCTTRVTVDGVTYGPGAEPLRRLSRTVRGDGTVDSPLIVTTRLTVGRLGVYVDQVDTLVRGSAGWASTVTVRNSTDTGRDVSVTRAVPCTGGDPTGQPAGATCDAGGHTARIEAYTLGVARATGDDTVELTWNRFLAPDRSAAFRSRLFFDVSTPAGADDDTGPRGAAG